MAQIKVYGLVKELGQYKRQLSDIIHTCVVDCLQFPIEKRFHRFFLMDEGDFIFPSNRSSKYTVIEVSIFDGRSAEAKRKLIESLFKAIHQQLNIDPNDIEITIFETPKVNWGIRGANGEDLILNYSVNV